MDDDIKAAMSAMNTASARLAKCLTTSKGGMKAEAAYSAAYQGLVRLGLARQLRGKYRS